MDFSVQLCNNEGNKRILSLVVYYNPLRRDLNCEMRDKYGRDGSDHVLSTATETRCGRETDKEEVTTS